MNSTDKPGQVTRREALKQTGQAPKPVEKLRIATCQFSVSGNPVENAKCIRDFMREAAAGGAHLLHTSEACLSGYAGTDVPSIENCDWDTLRRETSELRNLAQHLKLWLVLGSAHFLDAQSKPTNCVYLIDPEGRIADRYDKCFCPGGVGRKPLTFQGIRRELNNVVDGQRLARIESIGFTEVNEKAVPHRTERHCL